MARSPGPKTKQPRTLGRSTPRAADGPPTPGRASIGPGSWGGFDSHAPSPGPGASVGAPASTFTARQTKNMLPGEEFITNSQEIVEYYVRNGLGAPIKVFYCVDAPVTDDSYTPYDLAVVPKEHVENKDVEHYTVTSSGVVHIRPGVQSEFTPLGEWMRDASVFTLLRQMRFFKMYLVHKMFKFWRANVRHKMYALVRAKIERKLFISKRTFNPALMEIGALCNELGRPPPSP